MSTIVLGAGISGLAAAYGLGRSSNHDYAVYEQQSRMGGYCQSDSWGGYTWDAVSHVLHFRSPETHRLVSDLLGGELLQQKRSAWVYYKGRYVPYPFQSNLGYLPLADRAACLAGYLGAWLRRCSRGGAVPSNFEEWIRLYLGEGVARRFMRPYNEKVWGTPTERMSVDWLRPFVPNASAWSVLNSVLSKHVGEAGYNSCFYFPTHGGVESLAASLESRIQPVRLNERATAIDLDSKTVRFQDGREAHYGQLISTMPLNTLARLATGLPEQLRRDAEGLRCTKLLSLVYCVSTPLPHSHHWLYFPESQYPFFRVVFQSNISPAAAPPNCSVIAVEISDPDANEIDQLDEVTQRHLVNLGFIRDASDIQVCSRYYFKHAYPIHDLGREARVSRLLEFLRSRDVWSIGRFGAWRYSSIDDALVEALDTVRLAAESGSVWAGQVRREAGVFVA